MSTTMEMRDASTEAVRSAAQPTRRVAWREVWIFSVVAYALAWAVWSPMFPAALRAITGGMTPAKFEPPGTLVLGMFAPLVAALVMRLFISKEGVRGSSGFRRPLRHYAIAVFAPIVFVFAVLGIVVVSGIGDAINTKGTPLWALFVNLLILGIPVTALLTFGEEYGWRGYLLPRLLPLGEKKAGLAVGAIWGAWHLPALLAGLNYPGQTTWMVVGVFAVTTVFLSMLHTRLFVASGASVMVVTVLHASLNAFSDRLTDAKHLTGDPLVVSAGGVIAISILAIVTLFAYRRSAERDTARSDGGLEETRAAVVPSGAAAP
jgi:membrane protease YdiL (CAAX protease family)